MQHTFFVHFFAVVLHDHNVKHPNLYTFVASDGKDRHELKLEKMGGVIWYGTLQPYMKNWANVFKF